MRATEKDSRNRDRESKREERKARGKKLGSPFTATAAY